MGDGSGDGVEHRTLFDPEFSDSDEEIYDDVRELKPLVVYACRECGTHIKRWYAGLSITGECPECFDGVHSENSSFTRFDLIQHSHYEPERVADVE